MRATSLILALTIGLFTAHAFATTYTFSVSDGNWGTSTNWFPNGTPGAGDTAIIPADTTCHVTSNQTIQVLEVESGGTLRMEGAELLIGCTTTRRRARSTVW